MPDQLDRDYRGDVVVGGPGQRRTTPNAFIDKLAVGPSNNNVYFLTCRQTGEVLLIDAAHDWARLSAHIAQYCGGRLDHVLTTHRHRDHVAALPDAAAVPQVRTYAGVLDGPALPVPPETLLSDGDTVRVGALRLRVLHVPGHTPGSVAAAYTDPDGYHHLFVGDTLFPGGVGATNLPGQDFPQSFDQLFEAVVRQYFEAFEDAWVYPGHGLDTTLKTERPALAEWQARRW